MPRTVFVCLLAVGVGACQTPALESSGVEKPNAFAVTIDAERLGVIIDRAIDGAEGADVSDQEVNATLRADAALKSAAARLVVLRNEVCRRGLVAAADCRLGAWPAWTREPPSLDVSIAIIQQRTQWLVAAMDRFTKAGCKAGVKTSGEELFCSVE